MNKYQEALDNLKNMGDKDLYNERHLEWTKILQELVDKANKYDEKETPMKVEIKQQYDYVEHNYVCSYELAFCSKCGLKVEFDDNYCKRCGQKLDWSDEVCQQK